MNRREMNDGRITMKEAMENIAATNKALPTVEEVLSRLEESANINTSDFFTLAGYTAGKPVVTQMPDGTWRTDIPLVRIEENP